MVVLTNKKAVGVFSCLLALVITILSCAYAYVQASQAEKPAPAGTPLPILMYHSILDSSKRSDKFVVTPKQLEEDFEYIKTNGYTPVNSADLINAANGTADLPEKPILITFDDGYFNNYTYLFPLLKKYDYKAIISIVGTYTEAYSNDGKPGNNNYSHITWDEIKEMHESGLVEIGNHTWDLHNKKKRRGVLRKRKESIDEYEKMLLDDVGKLQTALEPLISYKPQVFAFPFGNINKESQAIIAKLDFKVTLGCAEGMNYITTSESLINLKRYNRSGNKSTEKVFAKFEK